MGPPAIVARYCCGGMPRTSATTAISARISRVQGTQRSRYRRRAAVSLRACSSRPNPMESDTRLSTSPSGRVVSGGRASPRSSSVTVSPSAAASGSSSSMSGRLKARSHLLTALSDTCSCSASWRWVSPLALRRAVTSAANFVLSTMGHSPFRGGRGCVALPPAKSIPLSGFGCNRPAVERR